MAKPRQTVLPNEVLTNSVDFVKQNNPIKKTTSAIKKVGFTEAAEFK